MIKVSVAMAACNGGRYISEQISSVLSALQEDGELVISLDPSFDNTEELIKSFSVKDERVKLFYGKGKGICKNFENALEHCRGDIIFLCDQDDVWNKNKVSEILKVFSEKDVLLVVHDAKITDENLNTIENSYFEVRNCKSGFLKNILKNSYIGCCMAFKKELLNYCLPFPNKIPMHDQYLGLIAEKYGKVEFIPKTLIKYRRHSGNSTVLNHSGIFQMLKWRFEIIKAVFK
ncbi:MAG: glycosyltransferase family 2 protein [Candidatus Fimenecus sp.]